MSETPDYLYAHQALSGAAVNGARNTTPAFGALRLKGWGAFRIAQALGLDLLRVKSELRTIDEYPRRHEREIWNTLAHLERCFPQGSRKMTA